MLTFPVMLAKYFDCVNEDRVGHAALIVASTPSLPGRPFCQASCLARCPPPAPFCGQGPQHTPPPGPPTRLRPPPLQGRLTPAITGVDSPEM